MMQPQAQPQQQTAPTPVQPQAQPQQAPQMAPAQGQKPEGKGKPSGRAGQPYDPKILQSIEKHLNSVPPPQQQFVSKYMTPELAAILGIIIGQEAYDYFNKFADPSKELTVIQRPQQQGSSPATQAPQGQPQGQPAQSGGQPAPQPQPQANPPQPSIMGR